MSKDCRDYDPHRAVEVACTEADKRLDYPRGAVSAMLWRALVRGAKNDCMYCVRVAISGGPSHEASPNCRSGRYKHCTCDTCF